MQDRTQTGTAAAVKQQVIIVDDESSITLTLALLLRAAGHEVQTANSGAAALRLAETFPPDVLITDFAMPGMNGLELAAELSRRFPGCRLIIFTGGSDFEAPPEQRLPAYKLLFKPVQPDVFLRLLKTDARQPIPEPPRRPRALCVDDVESHRYSIARFLTLSGFDVLEASTGRRALAVAETQPDVIVLDIGLPDMSGVEVCRQLKTNALTAAIPVIHLTCSDPDREVQEDSRRAGAYDYIAEPFDLDYLLARTRSAVQVRYLASHSPQADASAD